MDLANRSALVTGGSRGIGKGIALELAKAGADVAVNYRQDADGAQQVVDEIIRIGRKAVALQADISNTAAAREMVEKAAAALGKLDILVNNAGTVWEMGRFVADADPAKAWRVMEVNYFGAFNCTWASLPHLRKQPRGDIIFISSTATKHANAGAAPYIASKAAIEGFARCLAREEQPNNVFFATVGAETPKSPTSGQIRVNVVAPTMVATEMGLKVAQSAGHDITKMYGGLPFERLLMPEDLGQVCVFLTSEKNTYISGQILYLDGARF